MSENEKPAQQWELLASPGHVLLQQVNVYHLKHSFLSRALIGAVAIAIAAFVVAPYAGEKTGAALGWVTGKISHSLVPSEVPLTPPPAAHQFAPVIIAAEFDPQSIPDLVADVAPAMLAQVDVMKAGKRIEDCNFAKITDPWFDGKDATPKCRYSKDGTRLWVWAYVKNGAGQHGPFAGLIVKMNDKVTYANVDVPRLIPISGFKGIKPDAIPRTVSMDFPELLIEGGK